MGDSLMDSFCRSEFWNYNETWNTDSPKFTPCFEKTVLVWVPFAFLWALSPLEVAYLLSSRYRHISWNWYNESKTIFMFLLILVSFFDVGYYVSQYEYGAGMYTADIVASLVRTVTLILAAVFMEWNRRFGMRTSSILSIFWILLLIFSFPHLISVIQIYKNPNTDSSPQYVFISYVLYYVGVLVMALLTGLGSDAEPGFSQYPEVEKPCPYRGASFLSRLCHVWFDSFMWGGFRKTLVEKDLWSLDPWDSAKETVPKFQKKWNSIACKSSRSSSNASFQKNSERVNFTMGHKKRNPKLMLILTIFKTFWPMFLFGSCLKFLADCLNFVKPQIQNYLIKFVEINDYTWKGYMYVAIMFISIFMESILHSHHMKNMWFTGLRVRSTIISVIYRKALQISSMSRKDSTVGEIVNLMAVDAQRLMDICLHINMLWSAPFTIILCLYFLYDILGVSIFAGVGLMVLMIPLNTFIADKVKTLQFQQMKTKDLRIKVMNEVLNGIRVLKLYAWEPSFEKQIVQTRKKEIHTLKKAAYYHTVLACMWTCTPFLVSCVTFATYVLIDENNVLDAQKAFVSLTLFNMLRMPLTFIPILVAVLIQTNVALQRIADFLTLEDLDPKNVSHDETASDPLIITNGTFAWGKDEEPVLRDINLNVNSGALVAVVGTVGSGKSSLLSAFLGEIDKLSGTVNLKGSVAYISQQAWIQNATLKNNIIFGKEYNPKFYQQVVEACALLPDFQVLPGGDETEIGEKGINLSGGQKQRVSLARALYSDSDIYLFDDPLSAVDSHVGKHIFERVIGPNGMLKYKTRVLVTHGITFLPDTEQVIVIKDGRISERGTFEELIKQKGAFAEFLDQHLQEIVEGDNVSGADLDDIRHQLESSIGTEEFRRKLDRAISQISQKQSEAESVGNSMDSVNISIKSNGSMKKLKNGSITQLNGSTTKLNGVDNRKTEPHGKKLIEAEQVEVGNVKWDVFKYYFMAVGLFFSVGALVSNFFFQAFQVGSNLWLTAWSENTYGTNSSTPQDLYLGVYAFFGLFQVASVSVATLSVSIGTFNAAKVLHNKMLSNILHLPQSLFDTTPVGRILTRFSSDVNVLDTTFPMILRMCLPHLYRVFATLLVITYSTPIFVSIVIPVLVIYYAMQRIYVSNSRQLKRMESASRAPIYSHFGESLQGASVIRAYGVQQRFVNESDTKVDFSQICYTPGIYGYAWLAVRLELVGAVIIFFASLFAILTRDSLSAAFAGLSISYALQITTTLNMLVKQVSDFETNVVAVERIKEYTEYKQEAAWENPEHTVADNWPQNGKIEFCNYEVRYREGLDLVLKGISFIVNGGEKVGIVGRTGAGKSSLTLGLFRIIEPAGGCILIDGVDITKLGLHVVRSRLTIIPQDPVLFSGTLRLNLDPFNNLTDDSLWKTLELAHLKTFVESLPAGLNHAISEGGENLSVGQRQLVCLARALLRKSKVLILDEATAAVDLETDNLIQETIRAEFKECTILTIAHRLNTILDYDRVVVLDKGEVIEYDSPQLLLQKKSSVFYGMAKDAGLV